MCYSLLFLVLLVIVAKEVSFRSFAAYCVALCILVSGPVPKLRLRSDTNSPPPSSLSPGSSLGHHTESSTVPRRKLEPGSMSIYDRSPLESPRGPGVIELSEFLQELNQIKGPGELKQQQQQQQQQQRRQQPPPRRVSCWVGLYCMNCISFCHFSFRKSVALNDCR